MTRTVAALSLIAALTACERVGTGYVSPSQDITASPSPSPTASSIALNCSTAQTASIFVGISSSFSETADPTYGEIAGYADVTNLEQTQAGVIRATTADVIQFANLDIATTHSAVGFPPSTTADGFPTEPHAFATADATASGTAITQSGWSTGRLPGSPDQACLSQPLALPSPGVFYFGDLDFFNTITSLRDVVVVTASHRSTHETKRRRFEEPSRKPVR